MHIIRRRGPESRVLFLSRMTHVALVRRWLGDCVHEGMGRVSSEVTCLLRENYEASLSASFLPSLRSSMLRQFDRLTSQVIATVYLRCDRRLYVISMCDLDEHLKE